MANSVTHAPLPYPIKGARYTIPITYLDADGDPTDPTTPDTEVSKDGAAFADCAEEVTTITGSNGAGYITLSGAEMDCSLVVVAAKVASGPKATLATLIPRVLPVVSSGTAQTGDANSITLQAGSNALHSTAFRGMFVKTTGGTGGGGTGGANNQVRRITDYNVGTLKATVSPDWETSTATGTTYEILAPEGTGIPKADVIAFASTAGTFSGGRAEVNVSHFGGTAGTFASGIPQSSLTTAAINAVADQVLDEAITDHRTANSLGAMLQPLHSGACPTIASPLTTTIKLAAGASSADDFYNGDLVVAWSADGATKVADYITDYVGSTQTATVTGFASAPQTGWTYAVMPGGTIPGASAPSAADNATAVWAALTADNAASGSFGERLQSVRRNTLAAVASSSAMTLDSGASTTTDFYKYATLMILPGGSNTCAGQSRQITGYTTGRVATVSPAFTGTPSASDPFMILPLGIDAATVANIVTGVWAAVRADNATAGSMGEYVNADGVRIAGSATGAANAKSFFDGTGYAGTNNVIPTVTTLTGHTPQTGDAFARLGAPAGASVSADVAAVKVDTAAILVDTGTTLDTAIAAILADTGTDGVVVATASKTGYALSNAGVDALYTRQLTESYAADGAAPTVAQALMQIQQMLTEFGISATTMTVKKLDGTTTAFTLTLNNGSAPTAITRAT